MPETRRGYALHWLVTIVPENIPVVLEYVRLRVLYEADPSACVEREMPMRRLLDKSTTGHMYKPCMPSRPQHKQRTRSPQTWWDSHHHRRRHPEGRPAVVPASRRGSMPLRCCTCPPVSQLTKAKPNEAIMKTTNPISAAFTGRVGRSLCALKVSTSGEAEDWRQGEGNPLS